MTLCLFSGQRREGDIASQVAALAKAAGLLVLVVSIDLDGGAAAWDLLDPEVQSTIMEMAEGGFVDVAVGGPPCATTSRARYNRRHPGPPPLRRRGRFFWGLPHLAPSGQQRVAEANRLWLFTLMVFETVSSRGGAHLWEHPSDPGVEPYPIHL